ncbi:hypothetical protein FOL46_009503, partial [Perkinsus olseni]
VLLAGVVAMVKALAASSEVADELLGFLSSASMARVTKVGSVIRKRRKLHAESDAASQRSTVQVKAIINQSVKNFYTPLPPSLFYGVSASVIAAVSNTSNGCYVPLKDII